MQVIDAVSRLTGRRAISPPPNPTRPTKIRKQRIIGSRRRRRLEIDGRHFRLGKQHGFRNRSFAPPGTSVPGLADPAAESSGVAIQVA